MPAHAPAPRPIRRVMDSARAINGMVFAVLFVVAVGLGQVFFEVFRGFDYHATSAILIILTVSVLDIASQRLRKLFLQGRPTPNPIRT